MKNNSGNHYFSEQGMSLVGALITIAILGIGSYAFMSTMSMFSKSTRQIEAKESVIQEASIKSSILQSLDFTKLELVCQKYTVGKPDAGNCSDAVPTSTHEFLYKRYKADAITDICLELSSCKKVAAGKMMRVSLSANHTVNGINKKVVIQFRKAK